MLQFGKRKTLAGNDFESMMDHGYLQTSLSHLRVTLIQAMLNNVEESIRCCTSIGVHLRPKIRVIVCTAVSRR